MSLCASAVTFAAFVMPAIDAVARRDARGLGEPINTLERRRDLRMVDEDCAV
jgi:hypothetical protein